MILLTLMKFRVRFSFRNILIISFVVLFAASVLTATVSARRNNRWRPVATISPTPTQTVLPTATPTKTPTPKSVATPISNSPTPPAVSTINAYITYYGWNDNDPPGTAIAYPKSEFSASIHEGASGVGSFDDPVTFASDPRLYPVGTKIYIPYIKKYAIMEDSCASCIRDFSNGKKHIDIWAGGNGQNESKLLSCEDYWTRDSEKIDINPQPGLATDIAPIFDPSNAVCKN